MTDWRAVITADEFQTRFQGQAFIVQVNPDTQITLKLADVRLFGSPAAAPSARQPFSAIFTGPGAPILAQQIIPLRTRQGETLELFLVPIGPTSDGHMQYEAAFG